MRVIRRGLRILKFMIMFQIMLMTQVATFQFNQGYGASLGSNVDIGDGSGGNYFNFMNADITAALTPVYTAYPITAGNNSYSVGIRGHFTGTFNTISNIKVWATKTLTGYGTGADITGSVQASGWTPDASDTGDSSMPTSEGAGLAPTYSSNYSQWIRLQLETAGDATPGDGGSSTIHMSYDET
ncbi:MAG: hypothetical protein ACWGQW_00315 [bacterium]